MSVAPVWPRPPLLPSHVRVAISSSHLAHPFSSSPSSSTFFPHVYVYTSSSSSSITWLYLSEFKHSLLPSSIRHSLLSLHLPLPLFTPLLLTSYMLFVLIFFLVSSPTFPFRDMFERAHWAAVSSLLHNLLPLMFHYKTQNNASDLQAFRMLPSYVWHHITI